MQGFFDDLISDPRIQSKPGKVRCWPGVGIGLHVSDD
jgi:hypothetical protein